MAITHAPTLSLLGAVLLLITAPVSAKPAANKLHVVKAPAVKALAAKRIETIGGGTPPDPNSLPH